jgi:uncharacterized membrane protein
MKRAITRLAVIVPASYWAAVVQVFCMPLLGLTSGLPLHAADYKFTRIDFQPLLESKRRFRMKNKIRIASSIFAVLALLALPSTSAFAQAVGNYVSFDVPNATLTRPNDVNNLGVIVGRFDDQNRTHGFMLADGVFTSIDFPGSETTGAIGINDLGRVVGFFVKNGAAHGFVLSHGVFRQIDFPGAIATMCHGINKKGQIVGRYLDVQNPGQGDGFGRQQEHGFLLSDDRFTSIDVPSADTTDAWRITDDGDIVGDWSSNGNLNTVHGYVLHAGQFRLFDVPGARLTASREVNASGQMVGIYLDRTGGEHGFLLRKDSYISFDFPGSIFTDGNGMNDSGIIVGSYADSTGAEHGYAAAISQD